MASFIVKRDGDDLEIPYSEAYRISFDDRHGEGRFEEFVRLLADRRNKLADVARRFSLSRERIRQLYDFILLPYLGESGTERMIIHTGLRVHGKFPEHVLRVWRVARRHGIRVSHVNHILQAGTVSTLHDVLQLNWAMCGVKHSAHPRDSWARVNIDLNEAESGELDFYIVLVQVPDIPEVFFMIPMDVLKTLPYRRPRTAPERTVRNFYLPLRKWYEYSEDWKVNWHTYQNAWHLFEEK